MRLLAFVVGFLGGMMVQLSLMAGADYLLSMVVPPMVVPQLEDTQLEDTQKVDPEAYLYQPELEWQYYGPRPWWIDEHRPSYNGCGCGCGCMRQ